MTCSCTSATAGFETGESSDVPVLDQRQETTIVVDAQVVDGGLGHLDRPPHEVGLATPGIWNCLFGRFVIEDP
jgi:hypothetical protein